MKNEKTKIFLRFLKYKIKIVAILLLFLLITGGVVFASRIIKPSEEVKSVSTAQALDENVVKPTGILTVTQSPTVDKEQKNSAPAPTSTTKKSIPTSTPTSSVNKSNYINYPTPTHIPYKTTLPTPTPNTYIQDEMARILQEKQQADDEDRQKCLSERANATQGLRDQISNKQNQLASVVETETNATRGYNVNSNQLQQIINQKTIQLSQELSSLQSQLSSLESQYPCY